MRMVQEATAHAAATGGRVAVREGVEVEAAMWLQADELESNAARANTSNGPGGSGKGVEASATSQPQPQRACWEVYLSDGTTQVRGKARARVRVRGCLLFAKSADMRLSLSCGLLSCEL